MSELTEIPIIGPDYAQRSREFNDQVTLNMYAKGAKQGSKTNYALYSCPGLKKFAQVSQAGARSNGEQFKGEAYFAMGFGIYKVARNGTSSHIGTITAPRGRITMVAGRSYLLIVDGQNGYTWDGSTFAQISRTGNAAGFPPGPTHCTYLDGYFIVNKANSDQFYISAIEDPTSWDALDYATASASPDNTLALVASFKLLYILGQWTTQIYYDSGNVDFPFTEYAGGGVMQFGILAPFSLVHTSVGLLWLATSVEGDAQVVHAEGMSSKVVSDAISYALSTFSTVEDAFAGVYRFDGRTIYQLTFPAEKRTFEYYIEDDAWYERSSYGIGRYRSSGIAVLGSDYLFADYESGMVYQLDTNIYDEDGTPLVRERQTKNFSRSGNRLIWHEFILDVQSGVGPYGSNAHDLVYETALFDSGATWVLANGATVLFGEVGPISKQPGPKVMLSWSDDGGWTWSNEHWRSLGKIGNYGHRVKWRRLGMSTQRIYRVRLTDPVDFTILGAYARLTEAEVS